MKHTTLIIMITMLLGMFILTGCGQVQEAAQEEQTMSDQGTKADVGPEAEVSVGQDPMTHIGCQEEELEAGTCAPKDNDVTILESSKSDKVLYTVAIPVFKSGNLSWIKW